MSIIVESGITSSGCIVQNDTMEVYGSAVQTTVNARGSMFIFSGGEATETAVNSGGFMTISSGGVATETTVNSGGSMTISSGGAANNATIASGGRLRLRNGTMNGVIVDKSGFVEIWGGTATQICECGGYVFVAFSNEISFVANTFTGPIANSATAHANTVASDVQIESGGRLEIFSGGAASGATVNSGGALHISSGGSASAVQLNAGGCLGAFSFAEDRYWEEIVDGSVSISDKFRIVGNSAFVADGGVADNTTVNSGGTLYISSGGAADNTAVNGGSMFISDGGTASGATVFLNGIMHVLSGGAASDTTMNGGSMIISSGGVASSTTVSGGALYISRGGVATQVRECGGYVSVASGAEVTFAANTFTGAITGSATVHSNTVASDVQIENGGRLEIFSGGVVSNATAVNGGSMVISSGGTADNTTVNSNGSLQVFSGGVANNTTIINGGFTNDARMTISRGGVADNTTVNGGKLTIFSGGVAKSTNIMGGSENGSMVISSGGAASGTTVFRNGIMSVLSGGTAEAIAENGGFVYVASGADVTFAAHTFTGSIIKSASVHANTVASNVQVVETGVMTVFEGGIVTGRLTMVGGGAGGVIAHSGAIIDFAAAELIAGDPAALINDWSRIKFYGEVICTITVSADQAAGEYALAAGAETFNWTVTVKTAETELGTLKVGGTLVCGDVAYTLNKANGLLSLTVGAPPPVATAPEVILTITDPNHDYFGTMGAWKVQTNQTVAWQDLTTLGEGYAYLGLGTTAAGKAMPDIYVYNADAKYIAAYVTDDTGAVASFDSIFLGEAALSQVGLADFNADGVTDLLLRTADGFVGYYANGAFAEIQGLGLEWTVAALGDVDGNGRDDVIIAHEAGYVGAYLVGNDGSITWADLGNLDGNTQIIGAGDVNGDGTDDVIVQVGANYYGAWLCGSGAVTGFFGIGTFDAAVQDIADYNGDGTDDLLLRTASGVVGAALISGADTTTWAEYGALGAEWSTKGISSRFHPRHPKSLLR